MNQQTVTRNKLVAFTYSILNSSGEIVERNDLPVTYVHGAPTEIFPQVVSALEGCVAGDEVSVAIPPEQAFGPRDPDLTFTDDIDNAPPEIRHVGAEIEARNDKGEVRTFRVIRVGDGTITADANHPLAGETITFKVTIAEVREPTAEEFAGDISRPPE